MNKEKLFAYVEALWNRMAEAEEFFGMDASFTRHERARWNGAYNAIKAAGLMEEYQTYRHLKMQEEIK